MYKNESLVTEISEDDIFMLREYRFDSNIKIEEVLPAMDRYFSHMGSRKGFKSIKSFTLCPNSLKDSANIEDEEVFNLYVHFSTPPVLLPDINIVGLGLIVVLKNNETMYFNIVRKRNVSKY